MCHWIQLYMENSAVNNANSKPSFSFFNLYNLLIFFRTKSNLQQKMLTAISLSRENDCRSELTLLDLLRQEWCMFRIKTYIFEEQFQSFCSTPSGVTAVQATRRKVLCWKKPPPNPTKTQTFNHGFSTAQMLLFFLTGRKFLVSNRTLPRTQYI